MSLQFLNPGLKQYLHRFAPLVEAAPDTTAWYEVASPVAAYQPIGAASYADSKINLANPGTYNLIDIVAPSWTSGDGLIFTGSEYLDSGLTATCDGTWSILARFSDVPTRGAGVLMSVAGQYTGTSRFSITLANSSDDIFLSNGASSSYVFYGSGIYGGVYGFAGKSVAENGSFVSTIAAGTGVSTATLYIGARTGPLYFFIGKIQALGVWDSTLTAPQVLEISTKMAVL